MNKFLVCAALGLVLAATEISAKKSCSSFKGTKCEKKGCDWSKTGDAPFKTCKEFAEDVAAPAVDAPVVQVDANVCSNFDTKRKCERKGCDWTKEGKRYKSCNDPAPEPSTNATADPTAEAAPKAPTDWDIMPGCCRAGGKQVDVLYKETYSAVTAADADAMCANQCIDDLNCTAYEMTKKKKKSKKNKSAQPKFICELHNSAIDSASKSTKSCRAATTTCNILTVRPLTDATFKDEIANCLAEDEVGGNCVNSTFGPMASWDVSGVTDYSVTFFNKVSFNGNITGWNTEAATTMQGMFWNAAAFNQPINDLETGAVTTMENMFYNADAFNQPINDLETGAVTTMKSMFFGAAAFNQPIDSWKTGAVTSMESMFGNAAAFNQTIASWKTDAVTSLFAMFFEATEMLAKEGCGDHGPPSAC